MIRLRQAGLLAGPLARAVAWPPIPAAAAMAIGVLSVGSPGNSAHLVQVRLAALMLCAGAAFALDDPAAPTIAGTPASLLFRRLVRVAAVLPLLATSWALLLWYAGEGLPVWPLTLELGALLAVTLAVAALAGGIAASSAILALFGAAWALPEGWGLFDRPGEASWRWAAVLGAGVVVFLWASLDPARRRLGRFRPVTLAVLAVALLSGCGGGGESGGKIAFVRSATIRDASTTDIWVMKADGSGQRRLTANPGGDIFPAWSPDRKRIAFTRFRGRDFESAAGTFEIWVMNADGSKQRRMRGAPRNALGAQWSPDGKRILYLVFGQGIWVMNADGSGKRRLASGFWAGWSPDGKRIAFSAGPQGQEEVYVMNVDASGRTRLTRDPADDTELAWSPKGDRIAFVSTRDGGEGIYVINPDGSDQRRLTEGRGDHWPPTWSPDGRRIAFTRDERRPNGRFENDIYVIGADGSGLTNLTRSPAYDAFPAWQP